MALKLTLPPRSLGVRGDPFRNLNSQSAKILSNLNQEIEKIEGRTRAGLMAGAKEVLKVAIPLTPKETGYLRSTAYRRPVQSIHGLKGPVVEIGYGRRGGVRVSFARMGTTVQMIAAPVSGAKAGTRAAIRDPKGKVARRAFYQKEDYAVYVHEIAKHYRVGNWKYLETALKQTQKQVLAAIQKRAHISAKSTGGGSSLGQAIGGLLSSGTTP